MLGLFEIGKMKNRRKYLYKRMRKAINFVFISNFELREDEIQKVIEIITNNAEKGICGDITARQIFELVSCSNPSVRSTEILSKDGGESWIVKISKNPLIYVD